MGLREASGEMEPEMEGGGEIEREGLRVEEGLWLLQLLALGQWETVELPLLLKELLPLTHGEGDTVGLREGEAELLGQEEAERAGELLGELEAQGRALGVSVLVAQGEGVALNEEVTLPEPEEHSEAAGVPLAPGERVIEGEGELEREALPQGERDAGAEAEKLDEGEREGVGEREPEAETLGEVLLLLLAAGVRESMGEPVPDREELEHGEDDIMPEPERDTVGELESEAKREPVVETLGEALLLLIAASVRVTEGEPELQLVELGQGESETMLEGVWLVVGEPEKVDKIEPVNDELGEVLLLPLAGTEREMEGELVLELEALAQGEGDIMPEAERDTIWDRESVGGREPVVETLGEALLLLMAAVVTVTVGEPELHFVELAQGEDEKTPEGERLAAGDPESVGKRVPVTERLGEALPLPLTGPEREMEVEPVLDRVVLAQGEEEAQPDAERLTVGLCECVRERVPVAEMLGECPPLALAVGEREVEVELVLDRVALAQGEAEMLPDAERLIVGLCVCVGERVPVAETLGEWLPQTLAVGEREKEVEPVLDRVALAQGEAEMLPDAEWLIVGLCECVRDRVPEAEGLGERLPLMLVVGEREKEVEPVLDRVALAQGEAEMLPDAERLIVGLCECARERVPEAEGLGERLPLMLVVGEREKEVEPVLDRLALEQDEAEAHPDAERLIVGLCECVGERVPVAEKLEELLLLPLAWIERVREFKPVLEREELEQGEEEIMSEAERLSVGEREIEVELVLDRVALEQGEDETVSESERVTEGERESAEEREPVGE